MLLKSIILEIYNHQKQSVVPKKGMIEREILHKIKLNTDLVIIISGIRRCGKSILLQQIIADKLPDSSYYNFEDHKNINFETEDFSKLKSIFQENSVNNNFIFDEIQNVKGWENFIRTEQDLGNKIIITGSNASLLSKELGTKLTGRHISYELFPFSYSEFLNFKSLQANKISFTEYLEKGGMPIYLQNENEEVLQQMFSDIVIRDIVVRYGLRNSKIIKELGLYLISNTGKQMSYSNLRRTFNIGSTNSVVQYISYFEDSYLLFTISKFSYSLKKQSVNPKKIYSVDTGLSSGNSLSFSKDKGRMLENAVFLSLRRKYKNIYYFQEKRECDFIVKHKNSIIKAIQVCYELNDDNFERETKGLLEALHFFNLEKGFIITLNQKDEISSENKKIELIPAWEWCCYNHEE